MFPQCATGRALVGGFAQVRDIAVQHLRRPAIWLNYMQWSDHAYFVCKCQSVTPTPEKLPSLWQSVAFPWRLGAISAALRGLSDEHGRKSLNQLTG
jgi:hypothetical protein